MSADATSHQIPSPTSDAARIARRVHKAVIPVAGRGTRFLPATKSVPKELLPVVDKPALQYIVEEVATAGIDDVLLVTARGKESIADHFDRDIELEDALEAKGDQRRLEEVRHPTELASVHSVRQGKPLGLGHAVLCAKSHVGDEPFAVLLGDDIFDDRDHFLTTLVEVQAQLGGSVVALLEVGTEAMDLYGSASVEVVEGVQGVPDGDVFRLSGLVEKPGPEAAPSAYAIVGRYVLDPAVFDVLERTAPGRGGEIQLTDALQTLTELPAAEGGGVHGVVFRGRRYDTGDKLDYLKAVVKLGADHPELGADFAEWLAGFVAGRHVELTSDPRAGSAGIDLR